MSKLFWKKTLVKALVQLCIGLAIGCIGMLAWNGKWEVLSGWVAGLLYLVGWRMEISESEFQKEEAEYWKNMWVNSRQIDLDDGFGAPETKPRYVTQEELDARRKRIMEFDFTEPKEKKENA